YQSDAEIDADGLTAELIACLVLCPDRLAPWRMAVERGGNNRGCDLPAEWTGLDKPIEVKSTPYYSSNRGHLLVRPPPRSGKKMCVEFVDDCYYVLLIGEHCRFCLMGWTDRAGFLAHKQTNPVGRREGQSECWGVHWSKLKSLHSLPLHRTARHVGQQVV